MARTRQTVGPRRARTTSTGGGPVDPPGSGSVQILGLPEVLNLDDGRVRISFRVAPPSPLKGFKGVNVHQDAPDAYGNTAEVELGEVGETEVTPTFTPEPIGEFPCNQEDPSAPFMVSYEHDAPSRIEQWRDYATTYGDNGRQDLVPAWQAGASPSVAFTVNPPAAPGAGREVAPWVSNPTFTIERDVTEGGQQRWRAIIDFELPVNDQNYSTMGGVIAVQEIGSHREDVGECSVPATRITTRWQTVSPFPQHVVIHLDSWGADRGDRNSIVPGATPHVSFDVEREQGPAGTENCANPIPGSPLFQISLYEAADGSNQLQIIANGATPDDPAYASYEVVDKRPDGKFYLVGGARTFPFEAYKPCPPAIESRTYYLRGVDVSGRRNTIVENVTPSQTISVGSGAGLLNLGKVKPGTYGPQLAIDGQGRLNIATGSLGQNFMATGLRVPEIVGTLPTSFTNYPQGALVVLTSDMKLYRSTGSTWTRAVDGVDLVDLSVVNNALADNAVSSRTIAAGAVIAGKLAALSVTAGTVAANVITANELAANSVTTNKIVANSITAALIAAGAIGTTALAAQYIDIGGGGNKCPRLAIRDGSGGLIGWDGDDTVTANNPNGSGFVGGWRKTFRLGGGSPATAVAIWDTSGNLTITFTQNSITTKLGNFFDSYQNAYCGMQVADASSSSSLLSSALVIYRAPTPGNTIAAFMGRLLSGGSMSVAHDNGSYNAVFAANNTLFGVARAVVELNSPRGASGLYATSTSSYLQIDGVQGYTGTLPAGARPVVSGGMITGYV